MNERPSATNLIITLILIAILFSMGWVIGSYIERQELAHDVCVTFGYDTGQYTSGEIVCGYRLDVSLDELAPIAPTPEPSGVYWSEEGQAL